MMKRLMACMAALLFVAAAMAQETSCNNGIDDDEDGDTDCQDSDCFG